MSLSARIFVGALVGILVALVVHPFTRPYFNPISNVRESLVVQQSPLLPAHVDVAPPPENESAAAYWMVLAAERIRQKSSLPDEKLDRFLEVSRAFMKREPGNAFWGQMTAVLEDQRGDGAAAMEAWRWASRRDYWDDHQSARLRELRRAFSSESGNDQSWHWLEAYSWRSTAPAELIARFAHEQWARSNRNSPEGLDQRYRILVNARRLRDGSRFVPTFRIGMNMIDLSARVTEDTGPFSPRQLLVSRLDLVDRMSRAGMNVEADTAQEIFRQYGSWDSLVNEVEADETRTMLFAEALLASAIPSAFLSMALFGGCLALVGRGFAMSKLAQRALNVRVLSTLAFVAGAVTYWLTQQLLVAVVVASAIVYLSYSPTSVRSAEKLELGSMFRLMTLILGASLALAWAAFWICSSLAGQALAERVGVPISLTRGSAGLISIPLSLLALAIAIGPLFSFFERYPSAKIFGVVIRQLGSVLLTFGLIGAVMLGPIAVKYDRDLQPAMERFLDNEPAYFYNRSVGPNP